MKKIKQGLWLLLLVIMMVPVQLKLIQELKDDGELISYQITTVPTNKSDFGFNPETKTFQVTSVELINKFIVENQLNDNYDPIPTDLTCPIIYNEGDSCSYNIPISRLEVVDKVKEPLSLKVTQISNYNGILDYDGNGKLTMQLIKDTGSEDNYNYYNNYMRSIISDIYNDTNEPQTNQVPKSFVKNYQSDKWHVKFYLTMIIVMIISFWSVKVINSRINGYGLVVLLFIVVNGLMYSWKQITFDFDLTWKLIIIINLMYVPMYLRIIRRSK